MISAYLDGEAKHCDAEDAEFILVEITHEDFDSAGMIVPMIVTYVAEATSGLLIKKHGKTFKYARLDYISYTTPKLMAVVGANLSGNFRCGLCRANNFDYYHLPIKHKFEVDSKRILDQCVKRIAALEDSKVTQWHHSFVTHHELQNMVNSLDENVEDIDRRALTLELLTVKAEALGIDNRVSMTTHAVYIMTAPAFAINFLASIIAEVGSKDEYMTSLKAESSYAKQLQTLFRDDLSQIFELQVLWNRVYDDVDWEKEKHNRIYPSTVPISRNEVFDIAKQIFTDGVKEGATVRQVSWKHYWQMRWASMPVGSVVSQYPEDMRLKKQLPLDAKIKAGWFCANQNEKHDYWYNRQPEIYASTSTKYEWGKVRALYGCDVTSFLHSDFAMINCEDTLPAYFPVGRRANNKYVKKIISTFQDGVPLCYDFDDFNSQHSVSSMRAVIDAWGSVFGSQLNKEQLKSLAWTSESLDTQRVRFNNLSETHNVNGTLLSGWRLTSFINTVLNRVYLIKAGLCERVNYALHNGDDVFATTPTVMDAMKLVRNAKRMGVRAQLAKTNIGTIGEFLRVDTRAKNPNGAQYLARSVATAVHGRVEMAPANDYREIVRSMDTRFSEMIDRGADSKLSLILRDGAIKFYEQLFEQNDGITMAIRQLHPLQGGINSSADIDVHKIQQVTKNEDKDPSIYVIMKRGLNDYANYVVERLGIEFDVPDREQMFRQMVKALTKPRKRYEIVIDTDPNLPVYRGLYKVWNSGQHVNEIALARSLGHVAAKTLPGVPDAVAQMIVKSKDPLKMMSVIL